MESEAFATPRKTERPSGHNAAQRHTTAQRNSTAHNGAQRHSIEFHRVSLEWCRGMAGMMTMTPCFWLLVIKMSRADVLACTGPCPSLSVITQSSPSSVEAYPLRTPVFVRLDRSSSAIPPVYSSLEAIGRNVLLAVIDFSHYSTNCDRGLANGV